MVDVIGIISLAVGAIINNRMQAQCTITQDTYKELIHIGRQNLSPAVGYIISSRMQAQHSIRIICMKK